MEESDISKILITGGAGFIGFRLGRNLAKIGHDVTLCDNLFRGKLDSDLKKFLGSHDNCKLIKCDLTNTEDLKALDKDYNEVYHLASIVSVKHAQEVPEKVLRANILIVINILDWIVESNCNKILYSSTSETYAGSAEIYRLPIPTPEDVPLAISDISNPRFSYAASKILGEMLFINYGRTYGLETRIIRPHNIYGPRMGFEHVIPEMFIRLLRKEDPFKLYSADQTRAFCYIDDAVNAIIEVMKLKMKNEIINVGNDKEEIRIEDLARKLFRISNFYPSIEYLQPPKGSPSRRCPDISKLRKLTGIEPKILLDEGLKRTFDWYRKYYEEHYK